MVERVDIEQSLIDFLCKHGLTFNQYAICILLYKKDTANIIKYTEHVGYIGACRIPLNDGSTIQEIDDLQARGYLLHLDIDKESSTSLDNYVVTDKFTKNLFADEDMAEAIWYAYPKWLFIGSQSGEKRISAKVCDYEEFVTKYLKVIKFSKQKHEEVLRKLEKYKRTNGDVAEMTIWNFVVSRHWENLEDENARPKTRIY